MNAPGKIERHLKKYYLSLGSNINPTKNIPKAINLLKKHGQVEIVSSAWKSPAMGFSGPEFINAALLFLSPQESNEIKDEILRKIESKLGRKRSSDKNAPREIDIDILIYEDTEVDPSLWSTPHLAVPLAEIHPDYKHPETGKTIAHAAKYLQRNNRIELEPSIFGL